MKPPKVWALLAALLFVPVRADDTDIYMQGAGTRARVSRIMLALDIPPGGGVAVCADAAGDHCRTALGERLLGAMDLYRPVREEGGEWRVEPGADGIPDRLQGDPGAPGNTVADSFWPGTRVHALDAMRAAIRVVITGTAARIGAQPGHPGFEVGLLVTGELQGFTDIRDPVGRGQLLAVLSAPAQPGSAFALREAYLTVFRYLTGQGGYTSPLRSGDDCARLVMVPILFGPPAEAHPDTDAALSAPYGVGGLLPGHSLAGEVGDVATVAAFNRTDFGSSRFPGMPDIDGSQNVTSHFIAARPDRHIAAMAAAGSGRALPGASPAGMLQSLEAVFSDIPQVTAGFVAGALLAAGRDPATSGDEIFLSLFRPRARADWPGNIKKLKIVHREVPDPNTGLPALRSLAVQAPLADPPRPALSPLDGRLLPDALTFWTDPDGADVLAYDADRGESPGSDGRSVQRGGAGQQIPGFLSGTVGDANAEPGARQLYTEDPDRASALMPLDATRPDWSALSPYLDPQELLDEAGERALVRWIRGQDVFDRDGDGDAGESRRWLLGDALHSRPLPVSYGARPGTGHSLGNPDVRLFFGANDGLFRMLQNTRGDEIERESGRETWAFIPLELLAMQSVLAGSGSSPVPAHPYGMDGEPVAYVRDRDRDGTIEAPEGDRVWVFIGQRRGGRGLYAFDMTDPDSPRLKWKITHRTPGFEQLAMTFSTPRVAHLDVRGGVPAVLFAGGYNGGREGASRVGKDAGSGHDNIGNAIYVVDADSGELIWKAVGPGSGHRAEGGEGLYFSRWMTHSIPSPLTVVDANHDGLADRAYVGDSGGNVWRIDLTGDPGSGPGTGSTAPDDWSVRRLAVLGGDGAADRRFFHAPDYVRTRDVGGDYHAVVITSGNRAAPLDEAVVDFAYLLKDRGEAADPIGQDDLVDITGLCVEGGEPDCAAADLEHGWRLQLPGAGEKGLSSPLVSSGTVLFTSYLPRGEAPVDACAPALGGSRVYALQLANGAARFPLAHSLDWPDPAHRYTSIGPGLQGDVVPYRDRVLIPGSGIDGRALFSVPGRRRWRVYWREDGVDSF